MSEADVREAFRNQALFCDRSGTPVTAAVVRGIAAALDRTTATGRRTLDWPGDARGSGDSVPLRLAGGFHALARRGVDPSLNRLYAGALDGAEAIVGDILRRHDAELVRWLNSPPQTNETGRAGPIMAGLMLLAAEYSLPFELIELGASAGLNLNLPRFGYVLGGSGAGDPNSPVQLAPLWEGAPPPLATVQVLASHGVDQNPVRIVDPAERERLIAYCWADQHERMERLQAALALADRFPPQLAQGDAADFAEAALPDPQAEGVCRVIYHTIFWTYLPPDKQQRIRNALAAARERDVGASARLAAL
ncbi:DUF2332 family protein [Sphingomonas sp. ID1715]|uniref:DUF2332 domain-containing protein n=1 Tax=Sphingomonas sp. ID1715 TaxID=1656898 RepID=UPI0014888045|nr:DUF2332 family protein [Sphingomonas sp. ID1715]NNM76917.1 DUF2332 family protein [Sphingomonas sp. ID1715]